MNYISSVGMPNTEYKIPVIFDEGHIPFEVTGVLL